MTAPHGPRPLCKRVAFDKHPEQRILPDCPDERCLKHLAWYKNIVLRGERPARDPRRSRAQLPQTTCDALDKFTCPIRQAQIDAMLLRMDVLKGYYSDPELFDKDKLLVGVAAKPTGQQQRPYKRLWLYDTGAARNVIGMDNLSPKEISNLTDILPCNFCTGNGVTVSRHTIDLKIPLLGLRRFYVMPGDCTPLCSVHEDVVEYGNIFLWDSTGPQL